MTYDITNYSYCKRKLLNVYVNTAQSWRPHDFTPEPISQVKMVKEAEANQL